jgi:hypothetical protein
MSEFRFVIETQGSVRASSTPRQLPGQFILDPNTLSALSSPPDDSMRPPSRPCQSAAFRAQSVPVQSIERNPSVAPESRQGYGKRLNRWEEAKLVEFAAKHWGCRNSFQNKVMWWKYVEEDFSASILPAGKSYSNAKQRIETLVKMRKNPEEFPDQTGSEDADDCWTQALDVWIALIDAEEEGKQAAKKSAAKKAKNQYDSYKLRKDLSENKTNKRLIDLPDFNPDDQDGSEYDTENRDEDRSSSPDQSEPSELFSISRISSTGRSESISSTSRSTSTPVRTAKKKEKRRQRRTRLPDSDDEAKRLNSIMTVIKEVMQVSPIAATSSPAPDPVLEQRLLSVEKQQKTISKQQKEDSDRMKNIERILLQMRGEYQTEY